MNADTPINEVLLFGEWRYAHPEVVEHLNTLDERYKKLCQANFAALEADRRYRLHPTFFNKHRRNMRIKDVINIISGTRELFK